MSSILAFQVIQSPIVLPGVEGRITKSTGPFVLASVVVGDTEQPSPHLAALVRFVNDGLLEMIDVPESDVTVIKDGTRLPRATTRAQCEMQQGRIVARGSPIDPSLAILDPTTGSPVAPVAPVASSGNVQVNGYCGGRR
jgi:hypothetical protein